MPSQASLIRLIGVQLDVIGALLMREVLTRFGRRNIGFAWLFVEPMMFTAGVTIVWTLTRSFHPSPVPVIPFVITGYSTILMWRNSAARCARAIEPNLALLYHRNVAVIDVFAARLLLEIAGATISLVVLLTIFILAGAVDLPADPLTMVAAWFLLAWFTVGLGLIVGALSERSEAFERAWHTLAYLAYPFSGALFLVDWLPRQAQPWLLLNPMVHATEMLRGGYFGGAVPTHYSVSYFATVNAGLLLLGLYLVDRAKHHIVAE